MSSDYICLGFRSRNKWVPSFAAKYTRSWGWNILFLLLIYNQWPRKASSCSYKYPRILLKMSSNWKNSIQRLKMSNLTLGWELFGGFHWFIVPPKCKPESRIWSCGHQVSSLYPSKRYNKVPFIQPLITTAKEPRLY